MRGLGELRLPRFALCFVCTLVTSALALAAFAGRAALGA
jgi:hypothetical protein